MPSPVREFGKFFDVEYRVNGVWNNIFNDKFRSKLGYTSHKYLICAETYPDPAEDTHGLMMDLTVNQLVEGTNEMKFDFTYLAYEGKGKKGKSFGQIEEQLLKFFRRGKDAGGGGFESWAIGTRGSMTSFYYYESGHNELVPQDIVETNKANEYKLENYTGGQRAIYDITNDDHWPKIDAVMTWIASKAP